MKTVGTITLTHVDGLKLPIQDAVVKIIVNRFSYVHHNIFGKHPGVA